MKKKLLLIASLGVAFSLVILCRVITVNRNVSMLSDNIEALTSSEWDSWDDFLKQLENQKRYECLQINGVWNSYLGITEHHEEVIEGVTVGGGIEILGVGGNFTYSQGTVEVLVTDVYGCIPTTSATCCDQRQAGSRTKKIKRTVKKN